MEKRTRWNPSKEVEDVENFYFRSVISLLCQVRMLSLKFSVSELHL